MKTTVLFSLLALLLFLSRPPVTEEAPKLETIPISYRIEFHEEPDESSLPPLTPFF
ncbi:hypothetical protein N9124_01620 [bacterium]|nr:hypothetical protein [Akkermansiaceae bacterium]MDB4271154.1 hypothetical protein [bacterium]MDB4294469.1 hypothetical protein [Akkermansiaceae bacterium]MDB4296178.1 hypothetical protein [bacterium]MDB4332872.1 hypothetical protein [Akkermansiaceae bacterium]